MSFNIPQTNRLELLDLGRGTSTEVRKSLRDIRRINTYLGGAQVVCKAVRQLLRQHTLRQATILDIGTGSADIPARLVKMGQQQGCDLRLIALDNQWRHLQVARADGAEGLSMHLLQADAFRLPLADKGVDIVTTSLFLHHFRPPQINELLREFSRVSRIGWVANDLVRHYMPLIFFRLTWPIFARSYITRYDGTASLRRAYTINEMRRVLEQVELPGVTVSLRSHFPYRMSLVGAKFERA